MIERGAGQREPGDRSALSIRQEQIARLVVRGKSNRQIASILGLSQRTIDTHISMMYTKLGVTSRVALAARILEAGSPLVRDEADVPAGPPSTSARLIGRAADLTRIRAALREHRLVTITGSPGVGKTRVARALGDALNEELGTKVLPVDLAPLARGSSVAAIAARALGVDKVATGDSLAALGARLRSKNLVVIFDNCEHLVSEAALVADTLLDRCPRLRILTTSREPLRVAGESLHRLAPLPVPPADATPLRARDAGAFAAIELFVERAAQREPGYTLSDETAPAVAQACRLLDGLPLAIELSLSAAPTLIPRHRTIAALFDWSYDLLPPPEQRMFVSLAPHEGWFTAAAVAAAHGPQPLDELDVLHLLTSLVDKSLVVVDACGLEPRYRLLECARRYAWEKLEKRTPL